jgi:hypothetical protein
MEPTTALILTTAVSAAGSLLSGFSQSIQSRKEAAYDEANAKLARQQSDAATAAIRERARRLHGQQVAAAGASGVTLDGSSFVDAIADSDINAELDALTQDYNGRLDERNYRSRARAERDAADGALVQGVFGAGSKALSAYGGWLRS